MERHLKRINRYMMIGWLAIVVVLTATYMGELIRGYRDWTFMSLFLVVNIVPSAVSLVYFLKKPASEYLKYFATAGYLIMYLFAMMGAQTIMVFGYIIPMLSLMVLYHSPRLVLIIGSIALAINIACDVRFFMLDMIAPENIRDVEIQYGMVLFCFSFAYIASKIYNKIVQQNNAYIKSIDDKQKQLERVTLQTISTIANIIDAKDEYTKGHSYRVAEYSSMLAKEIGYDDEGVANVKYVGLLHDIGKIGIPDSILNKPGKLNDSEYALMRKHAEIGGNILSGNNMINGMDEGAKYHHERYDGHGYPQGLKGEEIPEMARIIGIADAYDAMTSNRVYRKSLSNETVISELKRCSGTQFDPKLAEFFVRMVEEGRFDDIRYESEPNSDDKSMAERSAELLKSVIGFKENAYDSEHDYLTGVLSRSAGANVINEKLAEGDGGLFLVDITNLHDVNEKHGIVAGDRIIKTTADMLSANEELTVVRFGGSEFLCFVSGVKTEEEFDAMMSGICKEINAKLRDFGEYENNLICVGGALSAEVGRDYTSLVVAADRARFYIKELEKKGCYLYKKAPKEHDNTLNIDLKQFIELIECGKNDSEQDIELSKIYDLVRSAHENKHSEMQLVLITVTPAVGKNPAVSDRDKAMQYLQNAIDVSRDESVITFRFSSVQCMVVITEPEKENADTVTERILNSFYKSYDKKNVTLTTEAASLPAAS